ncbi:MAG: tetratricopeptide repeat protein [Acidobacteriota bacterium]
MTNRVKKTVAVAAVMFLAGAWCVFAAQSLPKPSTKECMDLMEKGEKAIKAKQLDVALTCYNDVMKREPNYAPAYLKAASVHTMKQDSDQALDLLEKAIQVKPDFTPALEFFVQVANRAGHNMNVQNQPDKAVAYYSRIASLPGVDKLQKTVLTDALYNMGVSAFQGRLYDQSVEAFMRLASIPNIEVDAKQNATFAHYMLGLDFSILNKDEDAQPHLMKYIEMADTDATKAYVPTAHYMLAKNEYAVVDKEVEALKNDKAATNVEQKAKDLVAKHAAILEHIQLAIAGNPGIEDAYIVEGNYYYLAGDLDNAEKAYQTLIEKFPTSAGLNDYKAFVQRIADRKKKPAA